VRFRTDVVAPVATAAAALQPTGFGALVLGACSRVDRFVLDHFIRRRPVVPPPGLRDRLERAARFYTDPRFIAEPDAFFTPPRPLERARARRVLGIPDGEVLSLDYETDFEAAFPEARDDVVDAVNRRGVALWWRHAEPGHPVVLCVHGYGGGQLWLESLAFEAIRSYRAGIDVLLYVLPYHGARTPAGARHSGEPFFDMDVVRTNEAFARAIHELRALGRYLRDSGTGPVGAFGMSLGAYTVALLASVDPTLAFVAAMIPLVSFVDRWWTDGSVDPWLALALEHGWSRTGIEAIMRVHEPLSRPPLVARDRRLVIGALGDAICTPEHAERLWQHWERPRMYWYPGGHLVQLGRGAALRAVRALIADAGLVRWSETREPPRPASVARSRPPAMVRQLTVRRAARRPHKSRTTAVRVR
jgi:pimeloyl-ACP methyl ester carboxylesterase